jgi:hypothetical protein
VDAAISRLQTLIAPNAAKYETVTEHWIHGWDEGLSFCRECAEKKIVELLAAEPDAEYMLGGGWVTEGDSQAFCETCQRALENSFTDYGAETEIDHFEEYDFDFNSPEDCYAMERVIYALGSGNEELQQRLDRLALTILAKHEVPTALDSQESEKQNG